MEASILSIATAVPAHVFTQEEIAEKMVVLLDFKDDQAKKFKALYQNSAIQTRHSIFFDFKKEKREEGDFFGPDYPKKVPGMRQRNDVYKKEAPQLAQAAAKKALQDWGGDPSQITHVISVSCTGVIAPGIEFELIRLLGLKPNVNRLGVNFMGCFGAFKGLAVANAFAKEDVSHRILLVCTELCSLHLQIDLIPDNILANSLFSDGAAAAVIGMSPQGSEKALWNLKKHHSLAMENTLDKMAWEAGDTGFFMKLSPTVPVLLGRTIQSFSEDLLGPHIKSSDCDWAIHPGGKSILNAIEKSMKLEKSQTQASWQTLADYGNMSSATFLFVLHALAKQSQKRKWAFGVGFGPGLSLEGILLCRPE